MGLKKELNIGELPIDTAISVIKMLVKSEVEYIVDVVHKIVDKVDVLDLIDNVGGVLCRIELVRC